jgi:hypothetical protein
VSVRNKHNSMPPLLMASSRWLVFVACGSAPTPMKVIGPPPEMASYVTGCPSVEGAPPSKLGIWILEDARASQFVPPLEFKGGCFRIEGVSPGTWDIVIVAKGFLRHVSARVNLEPGSNVISVQLSRGNTISGYVLRPDGSPAPRATVYLYKTVKDEPETEIIGLSRGQYETVSDASGKFMIAGLDKIEGFLAASHSSGVSLPVRLKQGVATVTMSLAPSATLSGRVIGARNSAAIVIRSVADLNGIIVSKIDKRGRFEFGRIPAGEYGLEWYDGDGAALKSLSRTLTLISGQTLEIDVEMPR